MQNFYDDEQKNTTQNRPSTCATPAWIHIRPKLVSNFDILYIEKKRVWNLFWLIESVQNTVFHQLFDEVFIKTETHCKIEKEMIIL